MIFTLEQIDNGIEEAIRLVLVQLGYWPDVTLYLPETTNSLAAYEAAKAAIKTGGKDLIELVGVGSAFNRGEIYDGHIIIDRIAPNVSPNVGFYAADNYVPNGNPSNPATTYDRYALPKSVYDIEYNITYVCSTIKYERIIDSIIRKALNKTYLKGMNIVGDVGTYTAKSFNIILMAGGTVDTSTDNYIEKMLRYNIPEIMLDDQVLVTPAIPQISEIIPNVLPVAAITDDMLLPPAP